MAEEIDISALLADDGIQSHLQDVIDNASDQDKITYITEEGKRIAAIVPVDVAEAGEAFPGDEERVKLRAQLDEAQDAADDLGRKYGAELSRMREIQLRLARLPH